MNSERYRINRNGLDLFIASLIKKHSWLPINHPTRMQLAAKLNDLSMLIRFDRITTKEIAVVSGLSDIGAVNKHGNPVPADLMMIYNREKNTEINVCALPKEIRNILVHLIDDETGKNAYHLLKDKANTIIFTPKLSNYLLTRNSHDIGSAEELTRTIIVQTYAYDGKKTAAPWLLAATIMTGLSHITTYYENNGIKALTDYKPNEIKAASVELKYLNQMLGLCGTVINESERQNIQDAIDEVKQHIKTLDK